MENLSTPLPITIVSGLPRSGTSLMMQMLAAGGMPVLTDHQRVPDDDNPRGYLEFEPVKRIKQDTSWLADATGKAVKMVHLLLYDLPADRSYRVLFMKRNLEEVLTSQRKMLQRKGKTGAQLSDEQLRKTFDEQVNKVLRWMRERPNFQLMEIVYHELVMDPGTHAGLVNQFLGGELDAEAMVRAVDPGLYRNRSS